MQAEARRRKIFFGEAAVQKKIVDPAGIGAAARCQAIGLLEHVIKNGFSVDSFTQCLRSYYVPARVSFPHVLLELSRQNPDSCALETGVHFVRNGAVDLSLFPWYPQELRVLNELKYSRTFDGLLAATGIGEASLKKILGVLQKLDVIETLQASVETGVALRNSDPGFEHLIPVVTNAVLDEKLQVTRNGSSFISEQFKNLKVLISEANSGVARKVLTVSSPDAQDGKSLVSASLAFSFAMDPGRRVIIVDCDLRNPALAKYFGVTTEPGLLQCVADGRLDPYCYVRRLENLYFMTAGGTASNPIEILSMHKMRQLIDDLRKDFDTIILDAPPYSPIADARIVTGLSDGLIVVLRRGKTSYASTDRAFKAIDRNKLLGVVFNDVKPMLFHTYYNFGHYAYGSREVQGSTGGNQRTRPRNYLESGSEPQSGVR